jgi:3-hydroxy-9,10-secoandrosta-1,3,5(10)-triene-9,17-dione monooxygenase reductase component
MSIAHVDAVTFRRCCSRFATGIAIATVRDAAGQPHGLTVNSFTSVSLNPPLVLICLDYSCNVLSLFREAKHFGICVLREDQEDLSTRFALRGADRFDGVAYRWGPDEVPLVERSVAWFACRTVQVVESGDHAIFIGEVLNAEQGEGRPLVYYDSRYQRLA